MKIKISNDINKVIAKMEKKAKNMRNLSPVMADMAEDMRSETMKRFRSEKGPDGESWDKSNRAKSEGGKTLADTGRLKNSITGRSGKSYAAIGTNVKYAPVHQYGAGKGEFGTANASIKSHTRKTKYGNVRVKAHNRKVGVPWGDVPKRPFIGIAKKQMTKYENWIEEHILKDRN
jgi:phage virion morphogenesis protein